MASASALSGSVSRPASYSRELQHSKRACQPRYNGRVKPLPLGQNGHCPVCAGQALLNLAVVLNGKVKNPHNGKMTLVKVTAL